MNQETVSRSSLNSFRSIGLTLMICGGINVVMAIILQDEILSTSSEENPVVTGFWSGLPLLMSGSFLFYSSRKQTKQALASCVVPCAIVFTTSLIQAIESGMAYTNIRRRYGPYLDVKDCGQDKVCNFVQLVNGVFFGLMISSSIGAVACLIGAMLLGSFYLRTATEEAIPSAVNGVVLAQPSTQVITSYQITTPMQQPSNYGPPVYSIQPNHPQIETTRDSAILTP